MDLAERLAVENEALREEVQELRAQLGLVASQAEVARCSERLRVGPSAARLLLALLKAPQLTRAQCFAAMPARQQQFREQRQSNMVSYVVSNLRRALPAGCGITAIAGYGYFIGPDAKARIRALLSLQE